MLMEILGRLGGPSVSQGATPLLPPSLSGAATPAPASRARARTIRAEPLITGLASFASANDYHSVDSEASGEEDPDVALGHLMSRAARPQGPSSTTTAAPAMALTAEPMLESASTAAVQSEMLKVLRSMQRRRQDSDSDNELEGV